MTANNDNKEGLIKFIAENADKPWIDSYIHDVLEFDWVATLKDYNEDTLEQWAKELGFTPQPIQTGNK